MLSGPEHEEGGELQYAAAVVYRPSERWEPRLDFFGDFGPLRHPEPWHEQKHLVSPAIDWRIGHHFNVLAGIGYGKTEATEQRLVRAAVEWEF